MKTKEKLLVLKNEHPRIFWDILSHTGNKKVRNTALSIISSSELIEYLRFLDRTLFIGIFTDSHHLLTSSQVKDLLVSMFKASSSNKRRDDQFVADFIFNCGRNAFSSSELLEIIEKCNDSLKTLAFHSGEECKLFTIDDYCVLSYSNDIVNIFAYFLGEKIGFTPKHLFDICLRSGSKKVVNSAFKINPLWSKKELFNLCCSPNSKILGEKAFSLSKNDFSLEDKTMILSNTGNLTLTLAKQIFDSCKNELPSISLAFIVVCCDFEEIVYEAFELGKDDFSSTCIHTFKTNHPYPNIRLASEQIYSKFFDKLDCQKLLW